MEVFLAHSKMDSIRKDSSSGGAVKSILLDLIDQKEVDEVIITTMTIDGPKTIITKDKEEILSNTNSIYHPTNPLSVLNEIDPDKRYALVGLPCHIHNLKRLQSYGIANQVIFTISLFCNHTPSQEWTDEIKKKNSGIISYRGSGSPFKNSIHKFNTKYMPETCKLCHLDRISKISDISAGDPWFYRDCDIGSGKTLIVSNTKASKDYIEKSNLLELQKVDNRLSKYKLTPRCPQKKIPVYWWTFNTPKVNFGDYITPLLVKEFGYTPVNFDEKKHKEALYIIGSHPFQRKFPMKIWGAGCEGLAPNLSFLKKSKVYALRGKWSSFKYKINNIPLGDPGFLLPLIFPIIKQTEDYTLYITHNQQRNVEGPKGSTFLDIIDDRAKWFETLIKIVNASHVYTSSLHTIIICKAYGVPYTVFGKTSSKFKDLEIDYNPRDLLKVFPFPILNWRILNL